MEQHKAEQCGYVVKGKIEFTTGGKTLTLNPGDPYMIGRNVAAVQRKKNS